MSLFSRAPKPEYLIVGLGNPESRYKETRHNVGFMALDKLAEKHDIPVSRMKFQALTGRAELEGHGVLLMKPMTYMNNSGEAVDEAARFYKIPPEKIIVISDDINLAPGRLRIRKSGSAGGHNGLKSIIECLGSDNFPRVRVGIGDRNETRMSLADFVLSRFSEKELQDMEAPLQNAGTAAELILAGKLSEAMNRFN